MPFQNPGFRGARSWAGGIRRGEKCLLRADVGVTNQLSSSNPCWAYWAQSPSAVAPGALPARPPGARHLTGIQQWLWTSVSPPKQTKCCLETSTSQPGLLGDPPYHHDEPPATPAAHNTLSRRCSLAMFSSAGLGQLSPTATLVPSFTALLASRAPHHLGGAGTLVCVCLCVICISICWPLCIHTEQCNTKKNVCPSEIFSLKGIKWLAGGCPALCGRGGGSTGGIRAPRSSAGRGLLVERGSW